MTEQPAPEEENQATPNDVPWWILYPWADSIEEVWEELDPFDPNED